MDSNSKYLEYHKAKGKEQDKIELKVGMKFASATDFREALRHSAVISKHDLIFKKNSGAKVSAHCKEECGWRVYASWTNRLACFQIKTLMPQHKCSDVLESSQASYKWLANRYVVENLRDDPAWKVKAMIGQVSRDVDLDVSKWKAYRAKKLALKMIGRIHKEQYARLWDYCNVIKLNNPSSHVFMKVDRPSLDLSLTFKRIFISYEAIFKGFKIGCRPIIRLDGCFLKGPYQGHLLSAVGRDGNNSWFPIAFAMVEAENRSSWIWFLVRLIEAIGSVEDFGWSFISDRQKGLIQSLEVVVPIAEHRFCMRHMYVNFKLQGHKTLKLKEEMWFAATAFIREEFEEHMEVIKNESVDGMLTII